VTTVDAPAVELPGVRGLLLPAASILLAYMVAFTVPPLIGTLVDEQGMSHAQAGLLMTAFSLAYCLGGVPAGRLSDRLGPPRVLLLGTLLAGLATLGCAVASSLPVLLCLRLAVGVGAALVLTAGILHVVDCLPANRRAAGMGSISASAYVGTGIAYLATPLLVDPVGWRGVFALAGAITIAGALAVGLRPPRGATRVRRLPSAHSAPVREVLGNRSFRLVMVILFLAHAALYGVLTWIPPFMEDVVHLPDADRSVVGVIISVAAIPGVALAAIASRRGTPPAALAGISLAFAAPAILLALDAAQAAVPIAVIGALLVAGSNASSLPLFALAPGVVPPHAAGTAAGLTTTIGLAGAVIATYTGGLIVSGAGYDATFILFGSVSVLAAALTIPLARSLSARHGTERRSPAQQALD
jgi:DHA1 family bicyclomycin/chloramphenicol resistance-like MFS transporter